MRRPEIVPDDIGRNLAEFPRPTQVSVAQTVGWRGQEAVGPAIERVQGRIRRLERVDAVATHAFDTGLEGIRVPDQPAFEQLIVGMDVRVTVGIAVLRRVFRIRQPADAGRVVVLGGVAQAEVAMRGQRQGPVVDEVRVAGERARAPGMAETEQMRI